MSFILCPSILLLNLKPKLLRIHFSKAQYSTMAAEANNPSSAAASSATDTASIYTNAAAATVFTDITASISTEVTAADSIAIEPTANAAESTDGLSKRAQKKLLKKQKYEVKKAEKKAASKAQKKSDAERKRKEWDEKLAKCSEEEKLKLIEWRKEQRKERMDKRSEERQLKVDRLTAAKINGQKVVIDLEFSHLMTPTEIHSLVQQIMYCYAINGRCSFPAHLWLTGYQGEMKIELQRLGGFDNWIIDKDAKPYIETFEHQKENLVYLTADSETMLDEFDPKKIYIVGGIVDRNRWKGITMKKAQEQNIQTAKLPIGNFLKMSSSQVLTVNQVIEIILKFLETRDWKDSFFQVIPQRKRSEPYSEENQGEIQEKQNEEENIEEKKTPCIGI